MLSISLDLLERRANVRSGGLGDVSGLAMSMALIGLRYPILVVDQDGHYVVLDGHRRVAAARSLGWKEIAVQVAPAPADEAERIEIQLGANQAHARLNPIEEAEALKALLGFGRPLHAAAAAAGRTEQQAERLLLLLNLHPSIQEDVAAGKLSPTAALPLTSLPAQEQLKVLHRARDGQEQDGKKVSAKAVRQAKAEEVTPSPKPLEGLDGEKVLISMNQALALVREVADVKPRGELLAKVLHLGNMILTTLEEMGGQE